MNTPKAPQTLQTPLRRLMRQPLLRLLAGNLAIGAGAAALMLGGLLALNPAHLRELIFADEDAVPALALLLFGLLITFGSAAMGTAVMTLRSRGDEQQ